MSDLTKQLPWHYNMQWEGSDPSLWVLFIIDANGAIKHLSISDLPVGWRMEETLCLVKAFQFVETNAEVCPANRTSASPAIKPHPTASKKTSRRYINRPCASTACHTRKELQLDLIFSISKIITYRRQKVNYVCICKYYSKYFHFRK